MRLEQKAGHHAKVATAPTQRPEEIRMLTRAGGDKPTIRQDDVDLQEVVDRQAVLAREVARAPAQGKARDTGGGHDAKGHGKSERVGGMIDIARRATSINTNGSVRRIDTYALHQRQVDDQSVITAAKARAVVSATANGDEQSVVASELHRADDIGCIDALRDQARPLVDHAVVEAAYFVIRRVVGLDHRAAHAGDERLDGLARDVGFGYFRCDYHGNTPEDVRRSCSLYGWCTQDVVAHLARERFLRHRLGSRGGGGQRHAQGRVGACAHALIEAGPTLPEPQE